MPSEKPDSMDDPVVKKAIDILQGTAAPARKRRRSGAWQGRAGVCSRAMSRNKERDF